LDGREIVRYFGRDPWVVVGAGVEVLQESSFEMFAALLSIVFERVSQLRILGSRSLWGCTHVRQIVVPKSVEVIGAFAFGSCSCLEKCEFERPSHLVKVEERAFLVCSSLGSLDFPGSLEFIGLNCFTKCLMFSRLSFDSGLSLGRVVGDLVLDDFLSEIGIEAMNGDFEIKVGDDELGGDRKGWICESCGGRAVRFLPEGQRGQ
jgi:hypothetical protein